LVGGAIVLELFRRRPDEVVHCLVRGESRQAARERLHASLREAATLYGLDLPESTLEERCAVVLGDITAPGCGVDIGEVSAIADMWHCAASLKFSEADREEVESKNIGGTANALALAERLGVNRYNHFSTAYVVGTRTGPISEEPVRADRDPNNVYEETKGRAEAMVESANLDLVRILRPSIVVAHRRTGRCASNTGIYGFLDQMWRFKKEVEKRLGDYLAHRSVAVVWKPEMRLNMVPVDVVASATLALSERKAPAGIYHLASLDPPTLGESLTVLMDVLGMREPRYVEHEQQLNSIDAAFNRDAALHHAYLLQDKEFDCANTLGFCDPDLLTTGLDAAEVTRFARAYLELVGVRQRRLRPLAGAVADTSSPGRGGVKASTGAGLDLRYEGSERCPTQNGGALYYETYGGGPPLVFLNNFFMIAPAWRNFTAQLREECAIVTYDLQNQGASSQPGASFPFSGHADDVADLLDRLELEDAYIIGTSISTLIARDLALRHSERVRGLVLVGPIYSPYGPLRYRLLMKDWRARLSDGGAATLFNYLYPTVFSDRAIGEGGRATYLGLRQRFLALNSKEQIEACLEGAAAEQAADGSTELPHPTLLMIGDGDAFWSTSTLAAACEAQPAAEGVVIPDAGHLPFVEQTSAFECAVLDFVRATERTQLGAVPRDRRPRRSLKA
jgi:pimeloyl-ACP methyl ester carboxylesterase/thioester reductase-like protein